MLLEQGDIINERYEVCEKIGTGGMAIVYRAIDKKLSRSVTLKVMRAEYASDEEFLKRFGVEARAAACISHQNLVNVYDVGSDGLVNYIVMEYIDGVTLKDLIKKKAPFNNEETLGVAIQVATALEHAHKNGIIHRDIKPQNILITKEGIVKVTDFGIARAASEATLTSSGNTMGSVHYFSPEQARGIYVDYKSDLYSLGIVMFEMATGTLPFEGDTPVAIALKHINDPLPDIRELNPDVSESLVKIITLATQKLSAKRYQTVEELSNHLKRALTNASGDFIRSADENDTADAFSPTIVLSKEDVDSIRESARSVYFNEKNGAEGDDYEDESAEAGTERKVVFAAILTSLAIIGAVCWALYAMYIRNLPVRVEVPQFAGLGVEEAGELANELNLILSEIGARYSDGVEEGYILEQMIPVGDMVAEGESVPVVVSLGTDKVLIPDVVGKTYNEAYEIFDGLPFKTSIDETYDDEAPAYTIVRQEPIGGTYAESGASVVIYVSVGPESQETEVPDVREKSEREAAAALTEAKLTVGAVTHMESPNIPEGDVISQTVPPGRIVANGTAVGLMISSGPGADTSGPEPTPTPTPEPTEAPTESPAPSESPAPPEPAEVVWPLVLALPYKPEGVDIIEYQLVKTTSAGTQLETSGTASVLEFPIVIDVKGTGEARYDFYINDGGYKLQSTENINFSELNPQ